MQKRPNTPLLFAQPGRCRPVGRTVRFVGRSVGRSVRPPPPQTNNNRCPRAYLSSLVDERPVEKIAVVGYDDLRPKLGDVPKKPPNDGLLVRLVEDVEWSRERRLRRVLEVLSFAEESIIRGMYSAFQ